LSGQDWNEYSDDYPSCEYTHATLRIIGDDLDPDEVSELIGLEPTEAHRKGDPNPRTRSPHAPYPTGVWRMESGGQVASRDLRRHVDWLIELLDGREEALARLRDRGYVTNLHAWWVGQEVCGPTLSPRQLEGMSRYGLVFTIDWGQWPDAPAGLDGKISSALEREIGGTHTIQPALGRALARAYEISSRTTGDLNLLLDMSLDERPEWPLDHDLTIETLASLYEDWVEQVPGLLQELRDLRATGFYPVDKDALRRLDEYRQDLRRPH
jgi:hypothetical protein